MVPSVAALSIELLNSLLAVSPDWIPALICQAHALVGLGRLDDALHAANHAVARDPTNADAWETRGYIFERRNEWEAVLLNGEAWERSGPIARRDQYEFHLQRAIAHCAMDRIPEMEAAIGANLALLDIETQEIAARRKSALARVFRRAGKPVPEKYSAKKP